MMPLELKTEYVRLRAEGRSYSAICEQIHISKSTCTKWEKDLAADIDAMKRAKLAELCESYGMTKEARIRRLGDTLERIDSALDQADLEEIPPAKLLDLKLKYLEALKAEYIGTSPALDPDNVDAKSILTSLADLLNRVRDGEVTLEQVQKEGGVINQILRAYDTLMVKTQMDELEAVLSRRA